MQPYHRNSEGVVLLLARLTRFPSSLPAPRTCSGRCFLRFRKGGRRSESRLYSSSSFCSPSYFVVCSANMFLRNALSSIHLAMYHVSTNALSSIHLAIYLFPTSQGSSSWLTACHDFLASLSCPPVLKGRTVDVVGAAAPAPATTRPVRNAVFRFV